MSNLSIGLIIMNIAELYDLVGGFLADPHACSFEVVYEAIWGIIQANSIDDLTNLAKRLIQDICAQAQSIEKDRTIDTECHLLKERLEYLRDKMTVLSNVFIAYDLSATGQKVAELAQPIIMDVCFSDDTCESVKQNMGEIFGAFLRRECDIPEYFEPIVTFVSCMSEVVYENIFNATFRNEAKKFLHTLDLSQDHIPLVAMLYDVYGYVSTGIGRVFKSSTTAICRKLFTDTVLTPMIGQLNSEDMLNASLGNFEILHHLYALIGIGPSSWADDFIKVYRNFVKKQIDECSEMNKDNFQMLVEKANEIYTYHQQVFADAFMESKIFDSMIHQTITNCMTDKGFGHKLCCYINEVQERNDCITVATKFVEIDAQFEDEYCIFLAQRLLSSPSNVSNECEILATLYETGIEMPKADAMLSDYQNAVRLDTQCGDMAIHLEVMHSPSWPMLRPVKFKPPEIFNRIFDSQVQELVADPDFHMKTFQLSDRFSTVEFSNGEVTFSLSFIYACIVYTVLETGSMRTSEIISRLDMSLDDMRHINTLCKAGILKQEDGVVSFVGPPQSSMDEGSTESENRVTEDPVFYEDVGIQLDAAIVRMLKGRKFATTEEINRYVRDILPPRFIITDEKVRSSLEKLEESMMIKKHLGRENTFRLNSV